MDNNNNKIFMLGNSHGGHGNISSILIMGRGQLLKDEEILESKYDYSSPCK